MAMPEPTFIVEIPVSAMQVSTRPMTKIYSPKRIEDEVNRFLLENYPDQVKHIVYLTMRSPQLLDEVMLMVHDRKRSMVMEERRLEKLSDDRYRNVQKKINKQREKVGLHSLPILPRKPGAQNAAKAKASPSRIMYKKWSISLRPRPLLMLCDVPETLAIENGEPIADEPLEPPADEPLEPDME